MLRAITLLPIVLAAVALAQPSPLGALFGPVPVASVVDGDTFVVASNVGPRTVRLIGVDAPETQHPTVGREPFGPEAAAWLRGRLPPGTLVWLELDFGPEDAYGRLLAYAYVEDPAGDWTIDGLTATQLNLDLVAAGLARPLAMEPNVTYADRYTEAAAAARAGALGLWSAPRAQGAATGLPPGPIVIKCVLYDPDTPNDTDGESVTLLLRERLDTRGYYVWDEGSKTAFRLPVGEQRPGELTIRNPGQGVWNNGGDTVYLMLGETVVDAWDYTDARPGRAGTVCR
jgi:endonuclease YncB( thermonuclease family)